MHTMLPQYHKNKMKGNIGESIAQYVLSKFALVHKIDGSYDVGNDFICELIKDQYPTNLLFYVQVKYTQLEPRINPKTLNYWKGSPIPVYLFWVKDLGTTPRLPTNPTAYESIPTIEYKRCTPFLHKNKSQESEGFQVFSRVDFLNHLLIDYSRTQYIKGFTPILRPRDFLTMDDKLEIGLPQHQLHIRDVIPEYSKHILENGWINLFSLATVLSKKEGVRNKSTAREIARSALELITDSDREEYPQIVEQVQSLYIELGGFIYPDLGLG